MKNRPTCQRQVAGQPQLLNYNGLHYIDHRKEIRRLTADLESALIDYRQEIKRRTADMFVSFPRLKGLI
jgi:hypothetical protein